MDGAERLSVCGMSLSLSFHLLSFFFYPPLIQKRRISETVCDDGSYLYIYTYAGEREEEDEGKKNPPLTVCELYLVYISGRESLLPSWS